MVNDQCFVHDLDATDIAPDLTETLERALTAEWRLADGARLTLAANLDDRPLAAAAPLRGEILASTHAEGEPHGEWPRWYVAWALER